MRILLCPDSFKDSVSAWEVSVALEKGFRTMLADCDIVSRPLADGGEGTVECLYRGVGGDLVRSMVTGPLGEPTEAVSLVLDEGNTAVIELAQAAGLALVPRERRNPLDTTTFGVGELIHQALDQKCQRIILAVGGSATNDGGMGCLRALGGRFFNAHGEELEGKGSDLAQVTRIDLEGLDGRLSDTELRVLTDVGNPLYGPEGAAFIYAPQKGASPAIVERLDQGLRRFAALVLMKTGFSIDHLPGGGAAGGIGAGLVGLAGARLVPGIDTIIRMIRLTEAVRACDCVVSGEGRIDRQTFFGKTIHGVWELCREYRKPLYLVCGTLDEDAEERFAHEGVFLFPISPGPLTLNESLSIAPYLLERTARRMSVVMSRPVRREEEREE